MRSRVTTDVAVLVLSQAGALGLSFALTPFQLHEMGAERYGIVAVTSALLSYLSFFDFGVGWALTHFVPFDTAAGEEYRLRKTIFAALLLSITIGMLTCLALWSRAPWIVRHVLNVSPSSVNSSIFAVRVASVGLPVMLATSVFTGIGRGLGLFLQSAVIRFLNFGSLNVLWTIFAPSRRAVELVSMSQLLIAIVALSAWIVIVRRKFNGGLVQGTLELAVYKRLLSYGFFSSVSNLGYLLLNAADKLVLAAVVPLRDIVYYTIPFSLASQIPVVSITIATVLFPRFSASAAMGEAAPKRERATRSIRDPSGRAMTVFNGVVTFALVWWGGPFLRLWLGHDFASHATIVLQAAAIGFGIMALGAVDQVFLQAHGRVRTSASIFLIAGPLGVLGLLVLGSAFGIGGAAVATAVALSMVGLSHIVVAAKERQESPGAPLLSALRSWVCIALVVTAVGLGLEAASSVRLDVAIWLLLVVAAGLALFVRKSGIGWVRRLWIN